MKLADRWLALIAAVICAIMTITLAASPMVHRFDIHIPDDLAMWSRHWVEAGLAVIAVFFTFLHFAINRTPKQSP